MTPELETVMRAMLAELDRQGVWIGGDDDDDFDVVVDGTVRFEDLARAVLKAIRPPTEAVIFAGLPLLPDSVARPDDVYADTVAAWQAMVDQMLGEPTP